MASYNTRSAARKQAIADYGDVTVTPSATGEGTHIRWNRPSDGEAPTLSHPGSLEPETSFDPAVTPDQDEGGCTPTVCSELTEIADEENSRAVENEQHRGLANRSFAERELAKLQEQERFVETLAEKISAWVESQREQDSPANSNIVGQEFQDGDIGFGPEGRRIIEDVSRLVFVPGTNQLLYAPEPGEGQEVVYLPLNSVTQEDIASSDPRFRTLTPLPSFVSGKQKG
jgi:hypothetical protein